LGIFGVRREGKVRGRASEVEPGGGLAEALLDGYQISPDLQQTRRDGRIDVDGDVRKRDVREGQELTGVGVEEPGDAPAFALETMMKPLRPGRHE